MDAADKKDKEKWYPGKYLSKANKRRSVEVARSNSEDATTDESIQRPGSAITKKDDINNIRMDDTPNSYIRSGMETIGSVKVHVVDIKYLRISSAKLSIQLDRVSSQYAVDNSNKSFERTFDIHEISSDVRVIVVGKGDGGELVCGVVVIPLPTLLNFVGKPINPKEHWRQFYPISVNRISDGKSFKFSSGYVDLPGYALNRSKDPLGFVCIRVEVALTGSLLQTYFSKGSIGWKKLMNCGSLPEMDGATVIAAASVTSTSELAGTGGVLSNAELCAMIGRDLSRVIAVFRPPLSLTSVFSLPEVLVINMLLGCMCFILDAWQLPFAFVSFCVLNGTIAMSQRGYAAVTVWNDPLPLTLVGTPADPNHSSNLPLNMDPLLYLAGSVPASVNAYPAASAAAGALMQTSLDFGDNPEGTGSVAPVPQRSSVSSSSASTDGESAVKDRPAALRLLLQQNVSLSRVARTISYVAHVLEVACNLMSFADPRASVVAYVALFVIAAVASLGLAIWPRLCTVFMVTVSTTVCATGAYLLDMVAYKTDNKHSVGADQLSRISDGLDRIAAFLNRVPDELELTHRYIASTATMNPKGSEMLDAGQAFEKRVVR